MLVGPGIPGNSKLKVSQQSALAVLKAVLVRGKCLFPLIGTHEFVCGALSLFWEPLSTGLMSIFVGALGTRVVGVWKPQM